ncbi:MAG TPA: hypothetical protein VK752_18880 [Bryobacteraceae bacterium]|jgi:hypothetical protein|nr:hypothetical protein [Bryobacteraceae bacterium]
MGCGRLAIFCLVFAASAFGQMDGSSLRAKFGVPLNREVFTVRPRIEMIVDYSPTGNQVCRLELPGLAPMPADAAPGVGINTKKIIDEIVAEIVPPSMRGKAGASMCTSSGKNGMCSTDYENVSIAESLDGARRTAVIVRFKIAGCGER